MSLSLLNRSLWKPLLHSWYAAVAGRRFFHLWSMPNMRQKILPFSEHPQYGGSMLIQNVDIHPPNHIVSHPRIISLLWELHSLIKSIFLHLSLSKSSMCSHTKLNSSTSHHNTSLYTLLSPVCLYYSVLHGFCSLAWSYVACITFHRKMEQTN
jgi:hypothetical protein